MNQQQHNEVVEIIKETLNQAFFNTPEYVQGSIDAVINVWFRGLLRSIEVGPEIIPVVRGDKVECLSASIEEEQIGDIIIDRDRWKDAAKKLAQQVAKSALLTGREISNIAGLSVDELFGENDYCSVCERELPKEETYSTCPDCASALNESFQEGFEQGSQQMLEKCIEVVKKEKITGDRSSTWTHGMEVITRATFKATKQSILKNLEALKGGQND